MWPEFTETDKFGDLVIVMLAPLTQSIDQVPLIERIEYVPCPLFGERNADELVERLRPESFSVQQREQLLARNACSGASNGSESPCCDVPLLTYSEERYLFCRMNFARYNAERLRQKLPRCRNPACVRIELQALLAEALGIRNHIVIANNRLAISLAKDFTDSAQPVDEATSEAVVPLIRAVELFDFSRGYRFSTYATHAIRNALLRWRKKRSQHNRREATGARFDFNQVPETRPAELHLSAQFETRREDIARLLAHLTTREKDIMNFRFGLADEATPHTFKQIGRRIGLSKERVRVIARRALERIQEATSHNHLDWPEDSL